MYIIKLKVIVQKLLMLVCTYTYKTHCRMNSRNSRYDCKSLKTFRVSFPVACIMQPL